MHPLFLLFLIHHVAKKRAAALPARPAVRRVATVAPRRPAGMPVAVKR